MTHTRSAPLPAALAQLGALAFLTACSAPDTPPADFTVVDRNPIGAWLAP